MKLDDTVIIIKELKEFHKNLKTYKKYARHGGNLTQVQKNYRSRLREKLINKSGVVKIVISQLRKEQYLKQSIQNDEIWSLGLSNRYLPETLNAIELCIDATNEAIGIFETIDKTTQKSFIRNLSIEGKDFIATVIAKFMDEKTK